MTPEEFDRQVKEKVAEIEASGDFVEFEGWNCEEDGDTICEGWDGVSRRCDCGNRRVAWVPDDCGGIIAMAH